MPFSCIYLVRIVTLKLCTLANIDQLNLKRHNEEISTTGLHHKLIH